MKKNFKKFALMTLLIFTITQIYITAVNVKASVLDSYIQLTKTVTNSKGETGKSISGKTGELLKINYKMDSSEVPEYVVGNTKEKKKIVLVIDTSGSMRTTDMRNSDGTQNGGANGLSRLKVAAEAAQKFVKKFTNNNEEIAIVTYSTEATVVQPFTSNKQLLDSKLNELKNSAPGGATNIGDGMRDAYYLFEGVDESYSKNMILLTDGDPTKWSADGAENFFTGSGKPNSTQGSGFDDSDGKAVGYANVIGDMYADSKINSYLIGFTTEISKNKLDKIGEHAKSQKVKTAVDQKGLEDVYGSIADEILENFTVNNVNFQEPFPKEVDVVNMPAGFEKTVNSDGTTTVTGVAGSLSYKLEGDVFKLMNPIEFNIDIKFKEGVSGTYALSDVSKVTYNDFKNEAGSKSFDKVNIKVSAPIQKLVKIPLEYTRDVEKGEYNIQNGTTEDIVINQHITPKDIDFYSVAPEDLFKEKYIVVVTDNSGSMADLIGTQKRIDILKDTLVSADGNGFIDKLQNNDTINIALVNYNTVAQLGNQISESSDDDIIDADGNVKDFAQMGSGTEVAALKKQVQNITPGGGTNIGDGLRRAYWLLDKVDTTAKKYVILMTDGVPTAFSYENGKLSTSYRRHENGYYYEDGIEAGEFSTIDSATFNNIDGPSFDYAVNYGDNDNGGYSLKYSTDMGSKLLQTASKNYVVGFSDGINSSKLTKIAASANAAYSEAKSAADLQSIYDDIADEINKDLPIENLSFETVIPTGLSVKAIEKDGMRYTNFTTTSVSGGTKINFNLEDIGAKIEYKLNSENTYYKAEQVNFKLILSGNAEGSYNLLKGNTSQNNYSKINYLDIDKAVTDKYADNDVAFKIVKLESKVEKHGLFLDKTGDVSDSNFKFSSSGSSVNGTKSTKYTGGVVVDLAYVSSYLNVDLSTRDATKLRGTEDINVVVRKVSTDNKIGDIVSKTDYDVTKTLSSNGTTNIKIFFDEPGKYIVTYTFLMETQNTILNSNATIDQSSKDLKFDLSEEIPDLF